MGGLNTVVKSMMKNVYLKPLFYAALTLVSFAPPCAADETEYFSLSVENDSMGGDSDRYYTSGVRFTYFNENTPVPPVISDLTDYVPTFDIDTQTATFFTLGHNIYTPKDIRLAQQPNDDRPWSAFVYGSIGLSNTTHNDDFPSHIDELEFTLGLIGPEALGEPIQKFVHKYLSNSPTPRGWRHQLDFEPGVNISWSRRMPYALSYDTNRFHARIEPNFSVALGNIRTHAGLGATLILGSNKNQDTPPRVRPAIPGTGVFSDNGDHVDWQVFAGIDGRLVGRDIFLDGNTFSDSHSVDKNYVVGDLSAGASLSYGDYRLSYTLNARSREFKTQDEESIFGSVTLTKRF